MINDWLLTNVPLRRKLLYTYMRLVYLKEYVYYCLGFWHPPKSGQIPHIKKRRIIKEYAQKYSTRVLVETGTYLGDTIDAMIDSFDVIYSVELFAPLYEKAKLRFANRMKVNLYLGDSSHEIKKIISKLDGPALFWLDAHFSGEGTGRGLNDTPIIQELSIIFSDSSSSHIILIDDASDFDGNNGYPSLTVLQGFVAKSRPDYCLSEHDNMIFLEPRKSTVEMQEQS